MRTFRLIGNLILAAAGLGGSEARYDCWRAGRLSMAFMSMAVDALFWRGWSGSRDITDSGDGSKADNWRTRNLIRGALTVARLGHIEEDGLLPAALFDSIYFCHSKRYVVVE